MSMLYICILMKCLKVNLIMQLITTENNFMEQLNPYRLYMFLFIMKKKRCATPYCLKNKILKVLNTPN